MVTWDEAAHSQLIIGPKQYAWDAEAPVQPGPDGFYPCTILGATRAFWTGQGGSATST